jgi:inhibitor of cysteine peptidase
MSTSSKASSVVSVALAVMILAVAGAGLVLQPRSEPASGGVLPVFASYQQLDEFVGGSQDWRGANIEYVAAGSGDSSAGVQHSTTNVQVEGVDEADTVKTDGTYLYIASCDKVSIVPAYPPAALANATVITSDQLISPAQNLSFWISGIYLFGQRLVVVSSASEPWNYSAPSLAGLTICRSMEERGVVSLFDLTDVAHPSLLASYAISGYPTSSRMSGGVVYLVAQHYFWREMAALSLPRVWSGAAGSDVVPTRIHYDPQSKDPSSFVNILAVNLSTLVSNYTSVVAGYSTTVYMSTTALYLTFEKWTWSGGPVAVSADGAAVRADSQDTMHTSVYKIAVDGLSMEAVARGEVPGMLLNQFSVDEKDGMLRLATTDGWWTDASTAVYVLNDSLGVVGTLEGLAPGERIYSSRFLGDYLYLVTFRQVDPLFVVSLVDPFHPAVVGELKVPGFSAYLHPIDPGHLIGVGMENSSVKVSLFNVSDPVRPALVNSIMIPGWSSSDALWDHKAVLYDSARQMLVLPMTAYDNHSWNATSEAYVFNVSDTGVALKGSVGNGQGEYILRALYIGDYLYTVSETVVHATFIPDLTPAGSLVYAERFAYYLPYLVSQGVANAVGPAE